MQQQQLHPEMGQANTTTAVDPNSLLPTATTPVDPSFPNSYQINIPSMSLEALKAYQDKRNFVLKYILARAGDDLDFHSLMNHAEQAYLIFVKKYPVL